jgi:uncharacterized RDD family membrane protein YckC
VNESQNFNPYQPPKAAVEDLTVESHDLEPASKGLRFGTYIIDMIGYYALSFVVFTALLILGVEWGNGFTPILISLSCYFFYYVFFEGLWARTPGKFLFRTVVVNEDGGPPSLRAVLIRTLCRFIPLEPFSVLFAERGWHDGISDTRVVPVSR